MTSPKDYQALRHWHKDTGSADYYIEGQQALAALDNAPVDALFERLTPDGMHSHTWTTTRELPADHWFRQRYPMLAKT